MKNSIIVDFCYDERDKSQVESWCFHPDMIDKYFQNKTLLIAKYKNEVVGKICFTLENLVIKIELAEIKVEYRKNGIMRIMIKELEKKYVKLYNAFYLKSNQKVQSFWERLGFRKCLSREGRCMYKIFGEVAKELDVIDENKNYMAIWNSPFYNENSKPNVIFEIILRRDLNILEKPIIYFGNKDWWVEIKIGKSLKKDRFKKLVKGDYLRQYIEIEKISDIKY